MRLASLSVILQNFSEAVMHVMVFAGQRIKTVMLCGEYILMEKEEFS